MQLLLILGDALPPQEFPRGISERAVPTKGDSSAVPGGRELGKTFFRGCLKMVIKGEGPWGVLCGRGATGRSPGGAVDLEVLVLLGPPEGLGRSRGSCWGCSCDISYISCRLHTQSLCMAASGVD